MDKPETMNPPVAQKNHWIIISPIDEKVFAHVAVQQIAGIMAALASDTPSE